MEDSMDFGDWSSIAPPDGESIKVLVRIRPVDSEIETCINIQSDKSLVIDDIDHKKTFSCQYDSVLGPNATQAQVYDIVKEYTHSVLQGVNCTIFAYGQTGSGKTHSMYGPPNYINAHGRETEALGVIPRAIHHIFELSKSPDILDFQVHVSFVQIYNENLYDMLRDGNMNIPLAIRGDGKEIYVQGLSEYNVQTVGDTLQLLTVAEKNRKVRETYMNFQSSRSHSIFTINIEYKKVDVNDGGGEVSYKAKFNLVDLAGSEKWDTKRTMGTEHIAEMNNINLSLHTLGKCIASLAKASRRKGKERERSLERSGVFGDDSSVGKSQAFNNTGTSNNYGTIHVPYRESKLTRLLQDSLGGNAKTFMLATISPARYNCDETISTLKFADRAKQVMIQATINEFRPVDHAVVKRLQQENELFKMLVRKLYEETGYNDSVRQIIVSPPFDVLSLSSILPTASMAASPIVPTNQKNNRQYKNNSNDAFQQIDVATSMSAFVTSTASASSSPMKPSLQHSQSMQTFNGQENQESRLEYILSLERALNKEQVHAQHLTKKNETLIKELEDMKVMNMQLSIHSSHHNNHNKQHASHLNQTAPQQNAAMAAWSETIMQIPEMAINDLNASVTDMVRHNEELLTNTEQLQKIMSKFFKFQIEEDEMKRDVLQIFEVIKRLKGYITAQRVNEHFSALQSLQETLQRLKNEISKQSTALHSNSNTTSSSWLGKQLQPLPSQSNNDDYSSSNGASYHHYNQSSQNNNFSNSHHNSNLNQQQPQQQNNNVWSPPMDSRATSASNNTSSRVSSAALSAPFGSKPAVFKHQDFDFYEETNSSQYQNKAQHHNHQNQRYSKPQLSPLHQQHVQKSPSSDAFQSSLQNSSSNNHSSLSGGGGITFRVRNGPNSVSTNNKLMQSQNYMQQQQHRHAHHHHSSAETVASGETMLGGLAILESEEEIMAREYKEAKARQKKKEKLAQWMKEKEERAKAEQKQQEEERKAMLDAEREKEAKRKEYVQKQKAKLNQYHDKVKSEAEKIQELINLGIDPKSLNL